MRAYQTWTCILYSVKQNRYLQGVLFGYANLNEAEAQAQMLAELAERGMGSTHILQRGTVKRDGIAEKTFR